MKDKVIACDGVRVFIVPPGIDKVWTLMIEQDRKCHLDVVVAWYKTRAGARAHAKRLRSALKVV